MSPRVLLLRDPIKQGRQRKHDHETDERDPPEPIVQVLRSREEELVHAVEQKEESKDCDQRSARRPEDLVRCHRKFLHRTLLLFQS